MHHLLTVYLVGPCIVVIVFVLAALLWLINRRRSAVQARLAPELSSSKSQHPIELKEKAIIFDFEFKNLGLILPT